MVSYREVEFIETSLIAYPWYGMNTPGIQTSYSDLNKTKDYPDNKAHGANMEPIWGRQDPGGPHVGPMNFAG